MHTVCVRVLKFIVRVLRSVWNFVWTQFEQITLHNNINGQNNKFRNCSVYIKIYSLKIYLENQLNVIFHRGTQSVSIFSTIMTVADFSGELYAIFEYKLCVYICLIRNAA